MASKERKVKSKSEQDKLAPVPPNAGVEAQYRTTLWKLINNMGASVRGWLNGPFKDAEAKLDTSITAVKRIQKSLENRKLSWFSKFDEVAPKLAAKFVAQCADNLEKNFERQMKTRNFGIKFNFTPEMRAVAHAEISANVALIQSIPSQYFTEIEGIVMRSIGVGGSDLPTMEKELHERLGITKNRAAFIAQDQSRKVNAAITRLRQQEIGITKAIWRHNTCRYPRQSHIDFDGKEYDVELGAMIDGKRVWPGSEIGCHCSSVAVLPAYLRD